jgi:chromosome segregation ATPase
MKNLLLLLVLPVFSVSLNAQKIKISVDEKNASIGGSSHNCLVVIIYDSNKDDIEREWKSKMKDYDAKVSGKDEIFADNALIKTISENTCDVYARAEKGSNDNETKFTVGFLLGETWLSSSSNSAAYKAAEQIVKDFAKKMTQEAIDDKVKAQVKLLDKLNDEQESLTKKNKDLKEDITEYQEKIKKAEGDIKSNEDEAAKKKAEIEVQQKAVDAVKARQSSVE